MNTGNTSFPKLQLVRSSGRFIKTHHRREVLNNWSIELMVNSRYESYNQLDRRDMPICTMNTAPQTRPSRAPR